MARGTCLLIDKYVFSFCFSCTGKPNTEECEKVVVTSNILPPVCSAQISTKESLSFRFGRVEIRAKLPMGDWIVPGNSRVQVVIEN